MANKVKRVKYLSVKDSVLVVDKFPNFHKSGSVTGMRKVYGENALLVKCGDYVYNVEAEKEIYYIKAN